MAEDKNKYILSINGMSKSFGRNKVLKHIDLNVKPGTIMGLPGCVMYAKSTIFDIMLPRIAAGIPVKAEDFYVLGHGGLCLGCAECRFPDCSFGKV